MDKNKQCYLLGQNWVVLLEQGENSDRGKNQTLCAEKRKISRIFFGTAFNFGIGINTKSCFGRLWNTRSMAYKSTSKVSRGDDLLLGQGCYLHKGGGNTALALASALPLTEGRTWRCGGRGPWPTLGSSSAKWGRSAVGSPLRATQPPVVDPRHDPDPTLRGLSTLLFPPMWVSFRLFGFPALFLPFGWQSGRFAVLPKSNFETNRPPMGGNNVFHGHFTLGGGDGKKMRGGDAKMHKMQ